MTATVRFPRRALIVSADIGEGHNSAGRALAQAVPRAWPGCEVGWLDAVAAVGPRFARLARRFYVTQVTSTPRAYEFFFTAMWRHRWYLESTRLGMGALFGRRIVPHIRALEPDAIISTYPLGSAGLSWLRRRGQLPAVTAAWVPAFCPHPSWLYPNLDRTYVMHPEAVRIADQAEPGMPLALGALPVRDGFAPASAAGQARARAGLGLRQGRFTALVTTGSFGLGRVAAAVSAVLAAGAGTQAIVVCGRNEVLRRRLTADPWPRERLNVVGWTDEMAALMSTADIVVTNGGGTALEAIAAGRPVVITDPVPGHGRANAAVMAAAGLALLAPSPADLTAVVGRLAADPAAVAARASASLARATFRRREDDLADLVTSCPRERSETGSR